MAETSAPRKGRYSGSTQKTMDSGAMLGAKWWQKDDVLQCLYFRDFETKYGTGREFGLVKPGTLSIFMDEFGVCYKKQPNDDVKGVDKQITRFAMPPLAGFDMAMQDLINSGYPGPRQHDRFTIICVGFQEGKEFGMSDMPMFEISVD